jgi:hypothetical protein
MFRSIMLCIKLTILSQYTLQALMSMAGGDPVDIQRENRWPNHTTQGVKVEFKPHEDGSDCSDEEMIAPPLVAEL